MKKLLGFLSVSLWVGALVFSPAPASAFMASYPSNVSYFTCSQYSTLSTPIKCYNASSGEEYTWNGKMSHTTPVGSCSGSCNGTASLWVEWNPGNGRKSKSASHGQCLSNYILELEPCTACS